MKNIIAFIFEFIFTHKKIVKRVSIIVITVFVGVLLFKYLTCTPQTNFSFANNGTVVMFAHRGVCDSLPENTYQSVAEAQRKGFNGVEIDLRDTKDGNIVLFQNQNMQKMYHQDGDLSDYTLEQLQQKYMYWNGALTPCKITTLDTVFKDFPYLYYYLDVKTPTNKNIDKIVKLIRKYHLENRVIIANAHIFKQIRFKFKYPELTNCLEGFNSGKEDWIKFLPKRFRPTFYSSFIYKMDQDQANNMSSQHLLSRKIVYDVTESNLSRAMNQYHLRYFIIDIKKIPYNIVLSSIQ
jgi:Glycerophosphoryl diester phosphodiesterase